MPDNTDRKKINIRRTIAVITMVLALVGSVVFMEKFLCIPDSQALDQNRILMLHKEPKNTIDVLLIGSSATYSGFSSAYAYEKFGFTSYPYAIGGGTCTMWKPALQDALRNQRPKLVVVDVFGGGYERELIESRSSQLYLIMNSFPLSAEKIRMAKEISQNVNNVSAASMVFPFIKCHSRVPINLLRLKERLETEKFGPSPLKGLETRTRTRQLAFVDDVSFSEETMPIDEKTEGVIRDFLEYCKSQDLKVLFVKYPTVLTQEDPDELLVNLRANRICEIAEEYGFTSLNMQKDFHKIGLKEREDYYNHGHTNIRGQKKVTNYLGSYIQKSLDIAPTELDENARAEWDESVEYFHALDALSEELIRQGKSESIGESPALAADVKRIVNGEEPVAVAEKYQG